MPRPGPVAPAVDDTPTSMPRTPAPPHLPPRPPVAHSPATSPPAPPNPPIPSDSPAERSSKPTDIPQHPLSEIRGSCPGHPCQHSNARHKAHCHTAITFSRYRSRFGTKYPVSGSLRGIHELPLQRQQVVSQSAPQRTSMSSLGRNTHLRHPRLRRLTLLLGHFRNPASIPRQLAGRRRRWGTGTPFVCGPSRTATGSRRNPRSIANDHRSGTAFSTAANATVRSRPRSSATGRR